MAGGWIGGEEKLGKSYYAAEESLCIALGIPVCGHFEVPTRRRVLFISSRKKIRRDPACANQCSPARRRVRPDRSGRARRPRRLDAGGDLARLQLRCARVRRAAGGDLSGVQAKVVYGDVLRKLTLRDLNKSAEAGALLAILDRLRREYNVIFRLLRHYRKTQGFRTGRGSRELGGSFQLGAWAENSLFFEPIGRKQGAVRVEVQSKDAPPAPAFALRFESEGPIHDPVWVRLRAEELTESSIRARHLDAVLQALGTVAVTAPTEGLPGVTVKDLVASLKLAEKTVRTCLKDLETCRAQELDRPSFLLAGPVKDSRQVEEGGGSA
jgi:hypothetical protein